MKKDEEQINSLIEFNLLHIITQKCTDYNPPWDEFKLTLPLYIFYILSPHQPKRSHNSLFRVIIK